MKKLLFVLAILGAVLLAACSSSTNIADDVIGQVEGGKMSLSAYSGNEKNIEIPNYIEGAPVSSIQQSFAEGKAFESVVLPERIQGCYKDENGKLVLTTWSENGVIPINEKTAPWIFCSFFGTTDIKVNGIKYSCDTEKAVTDEMIVGEWRMKGDSLYTFTADGKIVMSDQDIHYEGTWQRQNNSVSLHMDADFDDNNLIMEYCGGCLVSWDYYAVLYQGEVPADPVYEETNNGDNTVFDEVVSGDFTYFEEDGGITIWAYNGSDPVVHIPEKLDGKTVVALEMTANDVIKELHIPKTVKNVYEIRQTIGLEVIYWTGVENAAKLTGLRQCYDIKELHLPGMSAIDLSQIALPHIERVTVLDISDCREVTGSSSLSADEIYVSEDIKYVQIPTMETGAVTLSATRTENSVEITDETWEEAWSQIFPFDTNLRKINGVDCSGGQPLMFSEGWWSGYSAGGASNEKVLYINDRGFSYIAEASDADRENPEQTMTEFELGIGYNWWHFGGRLWDLENNCYYICTE